MKQLLGIVLVVASLVASAAGVTYDGEFYANTKASASSKDPYVHPTNVVNVADKRIWNWWETVFTPLYFPEDTAAINFCNSTQWVSTVNGRFSINLGVDNTAGDPTKPPRESAYATTIGTSAKALSRHSYAYGSQINAIASDTTVIGYGASATSEWATVIGHGQRPSTNGSTYDKNFSTDAEMQNWLRTFSYTVFKGVHFAGPDGKLYTITGIRDSVDSQGYWYDFVETPDDWDYVPGGYDWRYGKSHGRGTFNIVALGKNVGGESPGLSAVYINDDSLKDLIGRGTEGPSLTADQKNKFITYNNNGHVENGAVEIGREATANLKAADVAAAPAGTASSPTKIRNVGIAIGTRAISEGLNGLKNQSIAIGFSAHAEGSSIIAIGPGSRDPNETDLDGNNAYAQGSASTAIGYNTKAIGNNALAIGSGESGTGKAATFASNSFTVAVGPSAQALAVGAAQIGRGVNTTPNSLQFQDVQIVKDGKLVSLDPDFMLPKEVDPGADGTVNVKAGNQVTIMPETPFEEWSEIAIEPEGSRNYTVYVPNEPEVREGMPVWIGNEIPEGIRCSYVNSDDCLLKLPVRVTVTQPYSKLVIIESEYLDDGEDWTPVVTNCNWVYNNDDSNPALVLKGGAKYAIEGIKLHAATNITVSYTGEGGVSKTVTVDTGYISTKKGVTFMSGTYFKGLRLNELKLPLKRHADETEFTIKYRTLNGDATFNMSL